MYSDEKRAALRRCAARSSINQKKACSVPRTEIAVFRILSYRHGILFCQWYNLLPRLIHALKSHLFKLRVLAVSLRIMPNNIMQHPICR